MIVSAALRTVLAAIALTLAPIAAAEAQQAPKKKAAKTEEQKTEKPVVYRIGDLTLSEVWSHQSASRNGAAFLKMKNAGEDDDALIDASTPVAKRIELHGPANSGEQWQTSRVNQVPAPAGQEAALTGTGLHLKLIGLRGALKAGETVPITLTFERAGAITVRAKVLSPEEAAALIEKTAPKVEPKKVAPKRKPRRRIRRRNRRR